jgi:RNA polymerase sigma-70 factor (ECF subfamily)
VTQPYGTPRDARAEVENLVELHGDTLYAISRQLCGNESDAEDLVQETFLNAFKAWDQFEGRSRPTTWLYTIAKRACIRRNRKRAGEPDSMESLEELLPIGAATVPDPSALSNPLEENLRRESEQRLEQALASLPLDFRLPLVLKDIAELSITEIAEILGLPENTIKTRVHRARLKLRKAIVDGFPQIDDQPDHSIEVCLDLLRAKQEALDRGADFTYSNQALCSRCRSMFATLDLGSDLCLRLGDKELPDRLKQLIRSEIEQRS